ncbi:hypothetical protein SH139x_003104 [Planctomycetaceae bacterium SH139]
MKQLSPTLCHRPFRGYLVRHMAVLTVIAACLFTGEMISAKAPQETNRAWQKANANDKSYFVPLRNKQWIEVNVNGAKISFQETNRAADSVELYDRGRDLRIRLGTQFAELSVGGKPYQRWVNGGWIPRSRLPDFAQLAEVDYRVRLIYFVPQDRQPIANYEDKIRCVMAFVNSLYKYEFRRREWDDRGFLFQLDQRNLPIVHLIRGKHPAAYYTGSPEYDTNRQYTRIQPEIPASIGTPGSQLIVAFMETYDEGPHPFEWPGGVALGGRYSANGGMGIFSAWILRDEFCRSTVAEQINLFQDETAIVGRTALGYGRPDSPRFEFIEDGFGAVMHEVGHALGLPHDQRDDLHYIMGNGFRKLRANLSPRTPVEKRARFSDANANILRWSRHLNPAIDLADGTAPKVSAKLAKNAESGLPELRLVGEDDQGLAAYLLLDANSGNVLDGDELSGRSVTESIAIPRTNTPAGQSPKLRLLISDISGNHTQVDVQSP